MSVFGLVCVALTVLLSALNLLLEYRHRKEMRAKDEAHRRHMAELDEQYQRQMEELGGPITDEETGDIGKWLESVRKEWRDVKDVEGVLRTRRRGECHHHVFSGVPWTCESCGALYKSACEVRDGQV